MRVKNEKANEKIFICLAENLKIQDLENTLPEKQGICFQKFLSLATFNTSTNRQEIEKNSLLGQAEYPNVVLKRLIEKDIFKTYVAPSLLYLPKRQTIVELSQEQNIAYQDILKTFEKKDIALLHGITSSGKTLIYIKLSQNFLKKKQQVLFLVPEITLTVQLVERLQIYFEEKIVVYHSSIKDSEKYDIWQGVQTQRYNLVLGARSAIFLPFKNLNFIIVDEEHDASYKQDKKPFYNARDIAVMLTRLQSIKVILGSATPSIESYFLSEKKIYHQVPLYQRYGNLEIPDIEFVNMSLKQVQRTVQDNFSGLLLEKMKETLSKKQQIILFQNRRGYAPFIICKNCGHVESCKHCAVSLTYHLRSHILKCHYCGYKLKALGYCLSCRSSDIQTVGLGTQKIEESLQYLFPTATMNRLDFDNTRKRGQYEQIITDFENERIDILVGTQMLSKGLNFKNVHLIRYS